MNTPFRSPFNTSGKHTLILKACELSSLSTDFIRLHSPAGVFIDSMAYEHIVPRKMELNEGLFTSLNKGISFPEVGISQQHGNLTLTCRCAYSGEYLCEHQAQVLTAILKKKEIRVFFDPVLRREKLTTYAAAYGLEREPDLDLYFKLEYVFNTVEVVALRPSILAVTEKSVAALKTLVLKPAPLAAGLFPRPGQQACIVLSMHKYYKHLLAGIYHAGLSKEGKLKNPLTPATALDFIWDEEDVQSLKFFAAIHRFQSPVRPENDVKEYNALRALVRNPLGYSFYYQNAQVSDKLTAASLEPVKMSLDGGGLYLDVQVQGQFYELRGTIQLEGITYAIQELTIVFSYFILAGGTLHLIRDSETAGLIGLFRNKSENLLIHASKFNEFKAKVLLPLEDRIQIRYAHIKPATPAQQKLFRHKNDPERIIYLSDFGNEVMLIPVMRYGEHEVAVLTKRQVYEFDRRGKEFVFKRNDAAEQEFTALILRQHPFFMEQLTDALDYFYLNKLRFLDEEWFLTVFEEWTKEGITVLGFNELEGNRLNANKVSVSIKVLSGIDWFNVTVQVRFGKKRVALKQVQKAVKNKSRFVQLDDGTLGILPADWLDKFTRYFRSAEIADEESLKIPKVNFSGLSDLFEPEMLDEQVREELEFYAHELNDPGSIKEVPVPPDFKGVLRHYQQQGLNWLNFMDDLNFGGCLADDMGLGKTIQIIAFILSLREKAVNNTNLVVVPASLIYNWQSELLKYAPSVKVHTIYGADRLKRTNLFHTYEVVLTSYGTLVADISFLKEFTFNYVFLDESQNIKNHDSQRNRAVRTLKSRNRIVITGTPVENSTNDLYGQFSFACPGLLGSKQYFKDIYAAPIDNFKSGKKAALLREKIRPFILRRTKEQVAPELPEKTEMVLYCDMQAEQRAIYNACEKELRDYVNGVPTDELKKTSMTVLKGLTKLRQITDSPKLLKDDLYIGTSSAKMEVLLEQIQGKMHRHKILVFSQFTSMLELIRLELQARKLRFSWLTGASRNRGTIVDEFQTDPQIRIFLISLKAGGTGLNLTEADYVYLVDPWWNPAVENQAIDRSHRIGQGKKIVAVRLICPDTVEEKIMLMQEAKKNLAGDLLQTDSSFFNELSKEDLLSLLT